MTTTTSSDHTIQNTTTVAHTTAISENLIGELRDLVATAVGGDAPVVSAPQNAGSTPVASPLDPPAEPTPIPDPTPAAPTVTPMNRDKPELPAYFIAMLAIIAIAVLTFHGDHVPEVLNLVAIGSLGIGGAVTTPKTGA